MKSIGLLLGIMILFTMGCGSNSGGDARLNGTWKYSRMVTNGKETSTELFEKAPTVTFKDSKIITKDGEKVVSSWAYKVDATQNPKQITITMGEPGNERKHYHLYKIEGDSLTMCSSNKTFSKSFNTKLEPGVHFTVRTRVK